MGKASKLVLGLLIAGNLTLGGLIARDVYPNQNEIKKQKEETQEITQENSFYKPIQGAWDDIKDLFKKKSEDSTFEKYGKNIVYFDFSQFDEGLVPNEKIKLPKDLEEYLDSIFSTPEIKNPQQFKEDFWEEAYRLNYSVEKFKKMSVKEAIMAAVEITASRYTYMEVDDKKGEFVKKYGDSHPDDFYFHLGLGDCDKYRASTIAAFSIIKDFNPKLENVYLSTEELGGTMEGHAWVSVLIPQKTCLWLSHIDPTFYDNDDSLEAAIYDKDEAATYGKYEVFYANNFVHIWVDNDSFKAYFYHTLDDYVFAYDLFEEALSKTKDEVRIERLLDDMSFSVLLLSPYKTAVDKMEWVRQQYESRGFTENLDTILYRSYKVYADAKNLEVSEKYKQRLFKGFPDSYWTKLIKKEEM